MADKIQAGTVGLPIRLTLLNDGVAHDPGAATYLEITFQRPRLEPLVRTGADGVSVSTDSQGRPCLLYTTVAGDLGDGVTGAGGYKVQGFLRDTAGEWPSEVVAFRAEKNIRTPTEG
jgi:hypothetical protein